LLAKDIATIDRLSGGRVELGIGAGWLADDYHVLGLKTETGSQRFGRLEEALEIIARYFGTETVDFDGYHYQVKGMEALPRPARPSNPPILVGAGGPRMLDLAGRTADIVGIHARMRGGLIDRSAVHELTADSIRGKIDRVRDAARRAGRTAPRLQFSCYHVHVTDGPAGVTQGSTWSAAIGAEMAELRDSPAVLVGTAAECADLLTEWSETFGITYWYLGGDPDAAASIIGKLR
jgi:alkanesulfonate monooxygenase SsuD/methylene tetrahydromethanopterin reductase-like flavin-dependent oxidoreductase (luciferase family)